MKQNRIFLLRDSIVMMEKGVYHFNIEKDPDSDWLVVQCVEYPAAISQGKTIDECLKNIKEALELVIEHKTKSAMKGSKMVVEMSAAIA